MKAVNGIILVETTIDGSERYIVYEQEKDATARINKLLPLLFSEPEKVPLAPQKVKKEPEEDYL